MDLGFAGAATVVVGGGRGMGFATAQCLADDGARVALVSATPLAATATRNLPPHLAGAGSGVYNTTRQVGSVLGSAGMAALMSSELSTKIPGADAVPQSEGEVAALPQFLREPFALAMSQSMLLPAFVALFGVIAALFLFDLLGDRDAAAPPAPDVEPLEPFDPDHPLDWADGEDDYVEYEVSREEFDRLATDGTADGAAYNITDDFTDDITDVLDTVVEAPAPADPSASQQWRDLVDQLLDVSTPPGAPRNGVGSADAEHPGGPRV